MVLLNFGCMKVEQKKSGYYGEYYDHISLYDDMLIWLDSETGCRQSSMIADSNWWWDWDRKEAGFGEKITFYFRDPSIALKFKLTWGTPRVLQD